jgi:hypothetical protein
MSHRIRAFLIEFFKDAGAAIAVNISWVEAVAWASSGLQLATTAILFALTVYRAHKLFKKKRHNNNDEIIRDNE